MDIKSDVDREHFASGLAESTKHFDDLVQAVGGVEVAAGIARITEKRIRAVISGDLGAMNMLHLGRLEAAAGKAFVSRPASERVRREKRAAMPTPTLREVRIASTAARLAEATYQHTLTCLPELPSINQQRAVGKAQIEADIARWNAEDSEAVYRERSAGANLRAVVEIESA